jgi:hypothetical protein
MFNKLFDNDLINVLLILDHLMITIYNNIIILSLLYKIVLIRT